MRITAILTGSLYKYIVTGRGENIIDLPDGSKVVDLISVLGIPVSEALMITRGNTIISRYEMLNDGDQITIVQAFEGG